MLSRPDPAWAVQAHGGSEGLVAHLIGHVLFTGGMAYLYLRLRRNPQHGPGWPEFTWFLGLIIAWNVLTFSGHWMHEHVGGGHYLRAGGRIVAFRVGGLGDAYFYLTRLDHLLLVPAFASLLLALRKWRA